MAALVLSAAGALLFSHEKPQSLLCVGVEKRLKRLDDIENRLRAFESLENRLKAVEDRIGPSTPTGTPRPR